MLRLLLAVFTVSLSISHANNKFALYKEQFGKVYATAEKELAALNAFLENDRFIEEHKTRSSTYSVAHNIFSDMTTEEFKAHYVGNLDLSRSGLRGENNLLSWYDASLSATPPASIDWVAKGAVTPVQNQSKCGGCWAFSTTGSIEGANFVENGILEKLSEQELVSCDRVDHGCQGGVMDQAYGFVEQEGICTEAAYPFNSGADGISGSCRSTSCQSVLKITGYKRVPIMDESSLKSAVAQQPVSIAIEADHRSFQLYHGGVYSQDCGQKLDHAVLAVGYGTDNGKDYWKIKNSWSPGWGEDGYIRIARGNNECGVAEHMVFPVGVKNHKGPSPSPTPKPPQPMPPTPPHHHHHNRHPNKYDMQCDGMNGIPGSNDWTGQTCQEDDWSSKSCEFYAHLCCCNEGYFWDQESKKCLYCDGPMRMRVTQ